MGPFAHSPPGGTVTRPQRGLGATSRAVSFLWAKNPGNRYRWQNSWPDGFSLCLNYFSLRMRCLKFKTCLKYFIYICHIRAQVSLKFLTIHLMSINKGDHEDHLTFIPARGQLIFLFYTRGKNFRESSLSKVRQTVKQRSQIQVLYSFLAETISKFKSCLPRIVRQTRQVG